MPSTDLVPWGGHEPDPDEHEFPDWDAYEAARWARQRHHLSGVIGRRWHDLYDDDLPEDYEPPRPEEIATVNPRYL